MTAQQPQRTPKKPITTRGRVVFWGLIVFLLLLTCGAGTNLIVTDGLGARRTLENGPVGTFAPADRRCSKDACAWLGTFTSTDGTVSEENVRLRDAEDIGRNSPMPARIDDVHLDETASDPTAYTADYNWRGSMFKGGALVLLGLGASTALVIALRRHDRATSRTPPATAGP